MNKRQATKLFKDLGFESQFDCDFRKQDSTLYWYDSYDVIITVSKDEWIFCVSPIGDIRISGKNEFNEFIFKGGKPRGELTYHLRKKGVWDNNNWFDVYVLNTNDEMIKTPIDKYYADICYTINDCISSIEEAIQDVLPKFEGLESKWDRKVNDGL